ncbi:MAG: carbohydrate porin [Pseudomonadota bacterium]
MTDWNRVRRSRRNFGLNASVGLGTLAIAMAWAPSAGAQDALQSFLSQDTLTGDWGGLRTKAENAGLTIQGNYQTDLLGNPTGGIRERFAYAGLMGISVDADLDKLAGLKGTSFLISGWWASGDDLSGDDIGNAIDVSQVFNGDAVRLGEMYLQQQLFDSKLTFSIGRIAPANTFATADIYGSYVNSGVNSEPFALPGNVPVFFTDPFAAWGAQAIVQPTDPFHVGVGVYNADGKVANDSENGVRFKLNPEDGVLTVAETGYQWQQADGDTGLPGSATFGGYYDSSDYDFVDGSNRDRGGNYGFYLQLQQMVYREGDPGSDEGLTPWVVFTLAPDEKVNTFPFSFSGGAVYKGLIPSRSDDLTAAAVYVGHFSNDLDDQNTETVVEVNHRLQLTPFFYVTPVFQYVFRPSGNSDIDDASVVGAEISIDF